MNSNTAGNSAEARHRTAMEQAIYDPDFRRRIRRLDTDALAEMGYRPPGDGVEFKVTTSTRDTTYLVLGDMSKDERIGMDELGKIQAAGGPRGMGCASTLGTASSVSSISGTLSTTTTAGSAATASTRD